MTERRKVAVLGGGVGGLTAAFELTRPEYRDRFDVTVYQLGWRLGGKGASGRNADHRDRIEEHGLHVWFGFYANAFRLMRDVYKELGRAVDEAFVPCREIALFDRVDGAWHSHAFRPPDLGSDPWEPYRFPDVFEVAARALRWGLERLDDATQDTPVPPDALEKLKEAEQEARDLAAQDGVAPDAAPVGLRLIVEKVRGARDSLGDAWERFLTGENVRPRLRLIYTTLDALAAAATGIVRDDVLERGFEAIDGEDWAAWLKHHGASELTIGRTPAERAPVLRAVYDVAFCFPEGDVDKANAAAGTATSDLLKLLFTYRGHLAYKMTAGMGDAIFAPLYDVLRRRGVTFRFFHAVTRIRPTGDGRRVEAVEVVPQLDFDDREYRPLVTVNDLPCWPHLPLWGQLPRGAEAYGTRFETELDPLGRKEEHTITLKLGDHFDRVVLAIPVGALASIASDLMAANESFRDMVEGSVTVQTQAFQVWTRRPAVQLGARHGSDAVAATFVEPLDTYCDMGHLIPVESWREDDGVRGIAYMCGVLKHMDGETPAEATERVKGNALDYLRGEVRHLWPRVGGDPWSELADLDDRRGEARFDAQYWRANTTPWERYVITPAGSVAKRLPSDRSGFANLVLAGDWTRNEINGGCVEAAAISGMQAARALTGGKEPIEGEDPRWLTPW